jgi:glutaredoxin
MNKISRCCSENSSCCGAAKPNQTAGQTKKKLTIDFLYLDLSVCERCQEAEDNLDKAVAEVSAVLKSAGYEVHVSKVNIASKELAVKYEFISSPTIRVNGKDIALDFKESLCQECGDLCGDQVECRVWVYEGAEYNEPPKEMIVNAILKEVYGGKKTKVQLKKQYTLPENLKVFFDGLDKRNG